jgi:two-component system CheB/CheR fusion protein
MLLASAGVQAFCQRVKIYATDLDEDALKVARLGHLSPHEVEAVPPELLENISSAPTTTMSSSATCGSA